MELIELSVQPDLDCDGTPESQWQYHRPWEGLEAVDVDEVFGGRRRLVVVAPHPDDELFGVGGLLGASLRIGRPVHLVAVTDGEASAPDVEDLAAVRAAERAAALGILGGPVPTNRLLQPDSCVNAKELTELLTAVIEPDDVVVAPWESDGHPDHDATGAAAAKACRRVSAPLWQYLVWAWHWDRPGPSSRIPWGRCRRFDLGEDLFRRKSVASFCFRSQIEGEHPILAASTLEHFVRPFEVLVAM